MRNIKDPDSMIYGDGEEFPEPSYSGTNTEPIVVKDDKKPLFKFENKKKKSVKVKNRLTYNAKGKLVKTVKEIGDW